MTQITKKLTVDLARQGNARAIFATQNDKDSRSLEITLTDDGKPYTIPSGSCVVLNCVRPDEASATFLASTTEDGVVTVTLGLWALSVAGEVKCSVSVFDGEEKRLTSSTFIIEVAKTLCDDDTETDPESESLLAQLVASSVNAEESEAARRRAEEQRIEAENARALAEEARVTSESSRADWESNRVKWEAWRSVCEQKRESDESARKTAEQSRTEAEGQRYRNEQLRVAAEELRESAETERQRKLQSTLSDFSDSTEQAISDFSALGKSALDGFSELTETALNEFSTSSQNAIDELNAEAERARKITDGIDSRLTVTEKRIENLESGISPDPFETDDSSAYERIVPEGACPYAELSRIGGSSCGSDGLLKLTDSPVTAVRSVSVTDGENGESVETMLYEFTVPEEIRALEGYGHGVNAEYCSCIDWRPEENIKKFVRRTRRITFKGTESWGIQSESFQTETSMMFATECAIDKFMRAYRPAASTLFKWNSVGNVQQSSDADKINAFNFHPNSANSHYIYVRIGRDRLETQDEVGFKKYLADNYAAGTPFVVEYAISTPEEIDLSEILDDDNLIPVSVGGRIVALNVESRDVPLEVTYQIKEAEV